VHGKPWRAVLDLYLQAAEGLAAAHRAGLVHRDFKPANVLVDAEGRARVADFGIARTAGAVPGESGTEPAVSAVDVSLTSTGALLGTPAYMAPEQFASADIDARADQFSFCVALHEALYGVRPFEGDHPAALYASATTGRMRRPPPGSPVPPEVHAVLARGLAADPARRFGSVTELAATLRRAAASSPAADRGVIVAVVVGVGLAVLAVGGALAAALLLLGDEEATDAEALASTSATATAPPVVAAAEVTPAPRPAPASEASEAVAARTSTPLAAAPEADEAADPPVTVLRPELPFMCGMGRHVIAAQTLELGEGRAFFVGGDCELVLENVELRAPVGVWAGGDARVRIVGGTFTGEETGFYVAGNATLEVEGARLYGRFSDAAIFASGYAKATLVDVIVQAPTAYRQSGFAEVTLRGGRYAGSEVALDVAGGGHLRIEGAQILGASRGIDKIEIVGEAATEDPG
jgi:hypothetical protein